MKCGDVSGFQVTPHMTPDAIGRRIPRLIVRSIAGGHDSSYDRSFIANTSRTISYDMMDLAMDLLQSLLIARPVGRDQWAAHSSADLVWTSREEWRPPYLMDHGQLITIVTNIKITHTTYAGESIVTLAMLGQALSDIPSMVRSKVI